MERILRVLGVSTVVLLPPHIVPVRAFTVQVRMQSKGQTNCSDRCNNHKGAASGCHSSFSSFPYQLLECHTIAQSSSRPLPILVDLFGLHSRSQARKACRQGEFLRIPPEQQPKLCSEALRINSTFGTTLWQKLEPVNALTTLYENDIVARVTRVDCPHCYPVELTKYIHPPKLPVPDVVYEDNHLAIVNKPEDVDTIGVSRNDLQSMLPFVLKPPPTSISADYLPRPVHRLDRRTSGLVIVAKTERAMKDLSAMFRNQSIHKTYTAVVFGTVENAKGTVDYPIDKKDSVSDYLVLETTELFSKVQVQPRTGRNHQIRRHLSYCLSTPIVGDNKYDKGRGLRNRGLFLVCNKLRFSHPISDNELFVSIPLPKKFGKLLRGLPVSPEVIDKKKTNLKERVRRLRGTLLDQYETTEGRNCTGEPAVDPSQLLRWNGGDSEWIEGF